MSERDRRNSIRILEHIDSRCSAFGITISDYTILKHRTILFKTRNSVAHDERNANAREIERERESEHTL